MIHKIDSTLTSFKTLEFHEGLNIVLAERTRHSSNRQTRNGAGKTSILDIVHLCTGSSPEADSIFRDYLSDYRFSTTIDVGADKVTVSECGEPYSGTYLNTFNQEWPITASYDEDVDMWQVSRKDWCKLLNWAWFGHPFSDVEEGGVPSFRSIFPYFVRLQKIGGFASPFTHNQWHEKSKYQEAVSFLLGLDWELAQEWERVRDKEKQLQELRQAAKQDAFSEVIPSPGKVRTKLTFKEEEIDKLRTQLESFRVHDKYHDLEDEASDITRRISKLGDSNALDKQYLAELQEAIQSEEPPDISRLSKLYERAGIVLPDNVKARFEDVREFHDTIIQNRAEYLRSEMEETQQRIEDRSQEIDELTERRAKLMKILESHGALEHFNELRSELSELEGEAESLRQQLDASKALEEGRTECQIERGRLRDRLNKSFQEQEEVLQEAIKAFGEVSSSLYEKPGQLEIDATDNGPEFNIAVEAQRSAGIGMMQVFCFDMMMMHMCQRRDLGPGFLIHDSHLFDPVDERQVARALEIGADWAERKGFQYIVTMNSDAFPQEATFRSGFSLDKYRVPVLLTDAEEDGGLFGFRFG